MKNTFTIYRFADCIVDTAERTVQRDGKLVAIPPKTVGVVLTFVERFGETLTKEEIIDVGWRERLVEEDT